MKTNMSMDNNCGGFCVQSNEAHFMIEFLCESFGNAFVISEGFE